MCLYSLVQNSILLKNTFSPDDLCISCYLYWCDFLKELKHDFLRIVVKENIANMERQLEHIHFYLLA